MQNLFQILLKLKKRIHTRNQRNAYTRSLRTTALRVLSASLSAVHNGRSHRKNKKNRLQRPPIQSPTRHLRIEELQDAERHALAKAADAHVRPMLEIPTCTRMRYPMSMDA